MGERRIRSLRVLACDSRMRILHLLQERSGPVTVDEVAEGVGLHVNTAREHLDRLVASGFVDRRPEHRTTRGRPRMLYEAIDTAAIAAVDSRARGHLVRLLLEGYGKAMESPSDTAELAGMSWAERLGCPGSLSVDDDEVDAESQVAALQRHLEDLGFEPELAPDGMAVHLYHCPFQDIPTDLRAVACGAHIGLARGVLSRHEGPLALDRLEKVVDGQHCVFHLAVIEASDAEVLGAVAGEPIEA